MTTKILYCLPWPPSLNHQYVQRKAKVKSGPKAGKTYMARMASDEARVYRQEVYRSVREGHRAPPRLTGRLDIAVLACPPASFGARRFDLDNYWKILLDSLKAAGVVEDDSLFDHEEVFRGNPFGVGRLLVAISPYDPDSAALSMREAGLEQPGEKTLW